MTKHYWLREYRCYNKECDGGTHPIQIIHSTDEIAKVCGWCGQPWVYHRLVKEIKEGISNDIRRVVG